MSERVALAERIDRIERAYEYLLAYAAQGRQQEKGSEVREKLEDMHDALEGLGGAARAAFAGAVLGAEDLPGLRPVAGFVDAVERDAHVAHGAVGLVLNCPAIPSLLVDNLNASVHLRALLTDVFLLEQALKVQ